MIPACKGVQETNDRNRSIHEAGSIDQRYLMQTWYHHFEEDSDLAVYRSDLDELPRVRFREKLIFEKSNQVTRYRPGPADRPVAVEGTWKWVWESVLILDFGQQGTDTLAVHTLNKKRLTAKLN